MPAAKFKIIRKCEVCGEEFYAKTLDSFYCSPRCSKIAYKRRKAEEMQQQRLDEMVKTIPEAREYITVTEAHALFGISRNTVYRLIEKGRVAFFNTGKNQTRLKKDDLMKLYPLRETPLEGNKTRINKSTATSVAIDANGRIKLDANGNIMTAGLDMKVDPNTIGNTKQVDRSIETQRIKTYEQKNHHLPAGNKTYH